MYHRATDDNPGSRDSNNVPETAASESAGLIRPRPVAATPPRKSAEPVDVPIEVLARMPDLDAEPSASRDSHDSHRSHRSHRSRRHHREEGRLLSSRVAAPLLAAVGLLLVAAAVLPLVLSKKESADATQGGTAPDWQSEESATGLTEPPAWNDPTARSVAATDSSRQEPLAEPRVFLGSRSPSAAPAPAQPAAAVPPTVQARASADGSGEQIASWRDAGQWPYGNGVGQAAATSPAAGPYPQAGQPVASYELPAGVQGSPIPYVSESPTVGMNRPMALNGPEAASPGSYPTGPPQYQQPPTGVYGSGSTPSIYSADARNAIRPQPATTYPNASPSVSPGGYPGAAGPAASFGGGYPVPATGAGAPIPAASDATSYSPGAWAAPQDSGAARLQGSIERPSARTTYDYDRSSIR